MCTENRHNARSKSIKRIHRDDSKVTLVVGFHWACSFGFLYNINNADFDKHTRWCLTDSVTGELGPFDL